MDEDKLQYYAGLNDGLGACHAVLCTLLEQTAKADNTIVLKMLIVKSVETIVSIMDETSVRLEDTMEEKGE